MPAAALSVQAQSVQQLADARQQVVIQVRFSRRSVAVSRICFHIGGLVIGGEIIGDRDAIADTHAEAFAKVVAAYVVGKFDGICLTSFGYSFRTLSHPPLPSSVLNLAQLAMEGGEPLQPTL